MIVTSTEVLFLVLGGAAGGFMNGFAGFGTALFALGFFLTVLSPIQAVAVTVLLTISSGIQGLWVVRYAVVDNPIRLLRFLLPAFVGIPIGIATLSLVNAEFLKIIMALFLIIYGGYFTFRANLPSIERKTPFVDCLVGFLGGILGGLAALSGALPTMWCSMRPWPKAEIRAVLQPFNLAVLLLTAIMLAFRGVYTAEILIFYAVTFPSAMVAAHLGIVLFKRLSDTQFRQALISLTFIAGIMLLSRALF